ncbi:hypothetical protein BDQ17DRAFT_1402226 [Cyathus striatus]|nr:hypothetical protein BDQ17DRAFT_1402226 [Cyathus striatus]
MDNAANCDSLARQLPLHLENFRGMASRTRCFAHIVNLIAKSFISFFFRKPEKKKTVTIAADTIRAHQNQVIMDPHTITESEIIVDSGDELPMDSEQAVSEEAEVNLNSFSEDDGKELHDNIAVKTFRGKAIQLMKDDGISIDASEHRMAMQIFPRVAGLARKVHDSTTLKEKFDALVLADPELKGTPKVLERQVVKQLTVGSDLKGFRLSEEQWNLAQEVEEVLLLFESFTLLFSMKDVPLVVEALPELENLELGLLAVRKDERASNVIHVAAQAALLVLDKYSVSTNDCEVYLISIVMCPDRKLKWFKDHGCTTQQIKEIKKIVIKRWKETYISDKSSAFNICCEARCF